MFMSFTAKLAVNSLIGSLMKKHRWGEINKVGVFSVPIGTPQDIGANGACSVITQMCHGRCKKRLVTVVNLNIRIIIIQRVKGPRQKKIIFQKALGYTTGRSHIFEVKVGLD